MTESASRSFYDLLSSYSWEVETWTRDSSVPAESGVVAIVYCAELERRITTHLTQFDIRTESFWDPEWSQERTYSVPVIGIGMPVEPVIYRKAVTADTDAITYLIGFRPVVE